MFIIFLLLKLAVSVNFFRVHQRRIKEYVTNGSYEILILRTAFSVMYKKVVIMKISVAFQKLPHQIFKIDIWDGISPVSAKLLQRSFRVISISQATLFGENIEVLWYIAEKPKFPLQSC